MSQTESINGVLERLRKVCAEATLGSAVACFGGEPLQVGIRTPQIRRIADFAEASDEEFYLVARSILPAALDCVEALIATEHLDIIHKPFCPLALKPLQNPDNCICGTIKIIRQRFAALAAFQKAAEK